MRGAGNSRHIVVSEGNAAGKHVLIMDDLCQVSALHVCLIRVPYMCALYVCLTCMLYMCVLYVCLIYMSDVYVLHESMC